MTNRFQTILTEWQLGENYYHYLIMVCRNKHHNYICFTFNVQHLPIKVRCFCEPHGLHPSSIAIASAGLGGNTGGLDVVALLIDLRAKGSSGLSKSVVSSLAEHKRLPMPLVAAHI